MQTTFDQLACLGLVVGAICGLAGTLITAPVPRAIFWTVDGTALVMASAMLTVRYFRLRRDLVAAGFLIFAFGQAIVLSTAGQLVLPAATVFAAGAACWAVGLVLISVDEEFPLWVRIVGFVSSVLFAITALMIQGGMGLTAVSIPLPFLAYPVLVLTFVGWIVTIMRWPKTITRDVKDAG